MKKLSTPMNASLKRILENAASVALGLAVFAILAASFWRVFHHWVVVPQQQIAQAQAATDMAYREGLKMLQRESLEMKAARNNEAARIAEFRQRAIKHGVLDADPEETP